MQADGWTQSLITTAQSWLWICVLEEATHWPPSHGSSLPIPLLLLPSTPPQFLSLPILLSAPQPHLTPCPYFLKTGTCRYGAACIKAHVRDPSCTSLPHTLLLPHLYTGPGLPAPALVTSSGEVMCGRRRHCPTHRSVVIGGLPACARDCRAPYNDWWRAACKCM